MFKFETLRHNKRCYAAQGLRASKQTFKKCCFKSQ